jgi:adenylate cyclase, class 2
MTDQELEIKIHIITFSKLEERLTALGAIISKPRVFEVNARFDTPDGGLASAFKVLRLRQDTHVFLTYKGPGQDEGGVRKRQEIEFTVENYDVARAFLEALGYQVSMVYEKYRTTYALGNVLVTLDELPYGKFAEIEGPAADCIHAVADQLGIDWDKRVLDSYVLIFERLRSLLGFKFRDLTFENFKGISVSLKLLGIYPAIDI